MNKVVELNTGWQTDLKRQGLTSYQWHVLRQQLTLFDPALCCVHPLASRLSSLH
ncbi:hypothetical protein HALOI3_10081 [Halomonas sp. I3]|nr:hypothetical protein HALOI3_10081 [Halomonas sp. I3]CAD5283403.1 hypothetical protein HALO156_190283 [Halomonas sp. 156]